MKTKVLFLLLICCMLAAAAALVVGPSSAHADDVPEKYRDTVHKGLEYLVKSQLEDGHWAGDGDQHPVAITGLAGLALLMETNIRRDKWGQTIASDAKYSANFRKAADWLMSKSRAERDGLIFSEHPSETARYMEGHGLATLFLAGVCVDERDDARRKKLNDVLTRAVKYIVKAQSTQGGWYHTSRAEGHDLDAISATVIQIQALQAAENAGIPVPSAAINDAREYVKKAVGKIEKGARPGQNHGRQADTTAALACIFNATSSRFGRVADEPKDELREKWLKYCQTEIPVGHAIQFGRDELIHYYYAQAVFNVGGDTWSVYRSAMFDHLQSSQNRDGSWPAPTASQGGICVGPVYSTALWCTILQLDKRRHPSSPWPAVFNEVR